MRVCCCRLEGVAEGQHHTDHGANTSLDTQPNLNRWQARWQEFLSCFSCAWNCIPGLQYVVADCLSRMPNGTEMTGTCRQHLGSLILTRGAKARAESQAPVDLQSTQGMTALAGPSVDTAEHGSRPVSVAAAPSLPDMPPPSDVSDIPVTVRSAGHWRDEIVSAYAIDPWFLVHAYMKDLSLDKGLWSNPDGRVVMPDNGDVCLKLIAAFHGSPYVGHVGVNVTTELISRHLVAAYGARHCQLCQ